MKKILLLLCCAFAATTTFAQKPTVGIKGGVNFASLSSTTSSASGSQTTGTLTTFSGGIFLDFKTKSSLSIQPALLYTVKGAREAGDIGGSNYVIKAYIHYLQVPVNFVYNAPIGGGTFFIGGGPYAAVGVSANVKATSGGETQSQDIEFGDQEDQYKRMDAGLTGLAGIRFNHGLMLGINYDIGLANISNQTESSTKTRVFGISLGFTF